MANKAKTWLGGVLVGALLVGIPNLVQAKGKLDMTRYPNLSAAYQNLLAAEASIEKSISLVEAKQIPGMEGHRVKAKKAIKEAMREIELGIESVNK